MTLTALTQRAPVKGADGKDYPLILGSNTFIVGFEPQLIGLKKDDDKTFELNFPKDYGVKALSGKKVKFSVVLKKVQEITEPPVDDAFAAQAGPFKSVAELKQDIKKQLKLERQQEAERKLQNELIKEIADQTEIAIPQILIDEQTEYLLNDLRQNLNYRGQTYPEYLESQGMSEEQYRRAMLEPTAKERVKAGLVLAAIAEAEKITVAEDEINQRLTVLRAQYSDPAMLGQLEKPEARSNIASQILSEKTIHRLVDYSLKK